MLQDFVKLSVHEEADISGYGMCYGHMHEYSLNLFSCIQECYNLSVITTLNHA